MAVGLWSGRVIFGKGLGCAVVVPGHGVIAVKPFRVAVVHLAPKTPAHCWVDEPC